MAAREAARAEREEKKKREGNDGENEDENDGEDEEAGLPLLPCIVAVDLQPMAPVEGIFQIQGDITSAATAAAVISAMSRGAREGGNGKSDGGDGDEGEKDGGSGGETQTETPSPSSSSRAQLVVCDGAPDVTGLHDMDEFMQSQLVVAALTVATELLEEGGTLVAKVFRGREAPALLAQLEPFFRGQPLSSSSSSSCYGGGVFLAKPRASRNASVEAFVVCRGYKAPRGLVPKLLGGEGLWPALAGAARVGGLSSTLTSSSSSSSTAKLIPFVACGDLRGWDADRSYDLPAAPAGMRRKKKNGKKKGNGGDGAGEGEEGEESEEESEEETFYVPLPPTALPTAPAYAGALALSGRPAAGMKGTGGA